MTFKIGEKEYKVRFTMLSIVSAKKIAGADFFEIANADKQTKGVEAMQSTLDRSFKLLLLALQADHADTFKKIEDVAALFEDMVSMKPALEAMQAELERFLNVDGSFRQRQAEAANRKKKNSRKTPMLPNAESRTG